MSTETSLFIPAANGELNTDDVKGPHVFVSTLLCSSLPTRSESKPINQLNNSVNNNHLVVLDNKNNDELSRSDNSQSDNSQSDNSQSDNSQSDKSQSDDSSGDIIHQIKEMKDKVYTDGCRLQ